MLFCLTDQPLETIDLCDGIDAAGAGGFCSFEGRVRDTHQGRSVIALEYEAHPPLCQSEADKILSEAKAKFDIIDAGCFHRVGKLGISSMSVWVGVTAGHRDAAFGACRYIIDELKKRLPIWKKEHYADGASEWLNASGDTPRVK